MKFNILVTGGLYSTQSAFSAWRFCQASIDAGHSVSQVFFYQDAVSQATALSEPMADEFNAVERWVTFADQTACELVVCVSAGERRGVIGQHQAVEFEKSSANLHPAFRVEGLGVLHDATLAADRTVTFK